VTQKQAAARRIVMVGFPGVQLLDVIGPMEVFSIADRLAQGEASEGALPIDRTPVRYQLEIAALAPGPIAGTSGLALMATRSLAAVRGAIDTLIVPGGAGVGPASRDPRMVAAVQRLARRARRTVSVCSGAFLLAQAGLLDGKRATTHWAACASLARRFPAVTVEPDPIFVRDGDVATSAGVTAGMDLALALVEEDCGPEVALAVARWLVLFVRRPGGQSQFSVQLAGQAAERRPLRELQGYIADQPAADLSVPALAARAGMSPRHFARMFTAEVGTTPAAYVERARVEVARRLLEQGERSIDEVAAAAGFGSTETLRRAFSRLLGVAPKDYRRRFTPLELRSH
jgi:transcriptional regulator GlxA family with amidase domain